MEHLDSLPPYTVRRSSRARRVRLTVSPQTGLVVVLPNRWRGDVDAIVASKHAWATRALAQVAERRTEYLAGHEAVLPERIELRAQSRALDVRYAATASETARAHETGDVLVVSGSVRAEVRLGALRRWLVAEGKRWLPQRTLEIVRVWGCPAPSAIRISTARTRWGSCSARKSISLNRSLLFLPPELCDSIIAHELAHLTHMDHSPRFWSHLATLDQRALEHRAAMKGAGSHVPVWVDV